MAMRTARPKQLSAFKIQDGDQIHIFPIAPYNEERDLSARTCASGRAVIPIEKG